MSDTTNQDSSSSDSSNSDTFSLASSILIKDPPEEIIFYTTDRHTCVQFARSRLTEAAPLLASTFEAKYYRKKNGIRVMFLNNTLVTVALFLNWQASSTLYDQLGNLGGNPQVYFDLAAFADKWEIDGLYDDALHAVYKSCRKLKQLPAKFVEHVYRTTAKGSALRKFVVDLILFYCKSAGDQYQTVMMGYSPEVLVDCVFALQQSLGEEKTKTFDIKPYRKVSDSVKSGD